MQDITLKQLLFTDVESDEKLSVELMNAEAGYDQLQAKFKEMLPQADWPGFHVKLQSALEELFEISLGHILVESWNKLREIRQVINQQIDSGSSASKEVKLHKHSIKSVHHPKLAVLYGGKNLAEFALTVQMKLDLEAVVLVISAGKISGIKTGDLSGTGQVNYVGAVLYRQKIPRISLPGKISLDADSQSRKTTTALSIDGIDNVATLQAKPATNWILQVVIGLSLLLAAYLFWLFLH